MKNRIVVLLLLAFAMPMAGWAQTSATPTYGTQTYGSSSAPAYAPAPMPDADMYAPLPPTPPTNTAQIGPQFIYPQKQYRGDGFFPGSTSQSVLERQLKPAPGIAMTVPLE
jgi:hypothetical protein